MLEQMKMHANLQAFCTNEARLEEYHLPCYNQALLKDNKAERAKRRSGPRSRGRNTTLTSSENKLLVVYPFKVEEEKLQEISSKLTELSGDRLGVAETPVAESDTDDPDDANAEENEVDRNPDSSDTSSRTHYLTIREDDRERLQPGQFLNDTLVDFWMSWCVCLTAFLSSIVPPY
jgi:Ulp1 family protease